MSTTYKGKKIGMDESIIELPNVLVIDDEEPVREAIIDILELVDIYAISACDGTEGLNLLQKQLENIQLVVLDLSMPGLSGEETFISIRELNPTIPILISSGFSISEISSQFLDDPNCEFMQKPFTLDFLIERVQHHLEK